MPRTVIPDHLIHKPAEVEENGRLIDQFISMLELQPREVREIAGANLLEKIRQKVLSDGELKLPFGLVIKPGR